jgi:hypothetical protein
VRTYKEELRKDQLLIKEPILAIVMFKETAVVLIKEVRLQVEAAETTAHQAEVVVAIALQVEVAEAVLQAEVAEVIAHQAEAVVATVHQVEVVVEEATVLQVEVEVLLVDHLVVAEEVADKA